MKATGCSIVPLNWCARLARVGTFVTTLMLFAQSALAQTGFCTLDVGNLPLQADMLAPSASVTYEASVAETLSSAEIACPECDGVISIGISLIAANDIALASEAGLRSDPPVIDTYLKNCGAGSNNDCRVDIVTNGSVIGTQQFSRVGILFHSQTSLYKDGDALLILISSIAINQPKDAMTELTDTLDTVLAAINPVILPPCKDE